MESKPTFWTTLPGILTGLAALLTAIGGLYTVIQDDLPWRNGNGNSNGAGSGTIQIDTNEKDGDDPGGIPVVKGDTTNPTAVDDGNTLKPLVDCKLEPYRLNNTLRSLMSWSDNYQGQIVAASGPSGQLTYACQQALSYRGSAHCQAPQDTAIRQALFETLSLCRDKGVDTKTLFDK